MFPKKKAPMKKQLGSQGLRDIMVGYDDPNGTKKAFRIFAPSIRKIVISPDVTFMDFKKAKTGCTPDVTTLTERTYNEDTNEERVAKTNEKGTNVNKQREDRHRHNHKYSRRSANNPVRNDHTRNNS